ncbi:MAG: LysR family transcriptional regulator [Burkholderiaceae bacterium]|jgi:molybdate transport system regulatory protein|nr:LysR family transcriptional regulator [Burkholderiaceae bacterium]MDP4968586.1 LysR family transcriptional regulator [Burkholderiaceae bacterium]
MPTHPPSSNKVVAQFRLRVKYGDQVAIGPGKIAILEAIAETGSISAAGRKIGMSYRRAWLLVDQMNQYFTEPVVVAATGGAQGGGTALTPMGLEVIALYRSIEQQAQAQSATLLERLKGKVRSD